MKKILLGIKVILKHTYFKKFFTKKYFDYTVVGFSVLLGFYLKWGIDSVALFSFAIWIILHPISSRVLARASLAFLLFTPLLLIIKRDAQAEKLAMFAYFFLILTVVTAAAEYRSEKINKLAGKKNENY